MNSGKKLRDKREFRLVDDLMFDSLLVLQWESGSGEIKSIDLPITVVAGNCDVKRYDEMRAELAQRGLFAFIYDDLRGLFARNRVSLSWGLGGSAFADSDPDIEKRAIRQIWKDFFARKIPALLKSPVWQTALVDGITPLGRAMRIQNPTLVQIACREAPPRYIEAKSRSVSFAVDAHIVIYSFLKRIAGRYRELVQDSFRDAEDQFTRELQEEEEQRFGQKHPRAIVATRQKIRDNVSRRKREESFLMTMEDDLRRLVATDVFKGVSTLSPLSYHDVAPAVFNVSPTYRRIYSAIRDFDEQFFNWRSQARSRYRRATPVEAPKEEGETLAAWKYSKMYQYWVYYQLCNAAAECRLKLGSRNFHSGEGSWVVFESDDGIQFWLFHEVKGGARGLLEAESLKAPLVSATWCAGAWKQDDDYATPDFACVVSHRRMPSFLIMLDAKSNPCWKEDEHEKARQKYSGFRLLLPGYNGNDNTPDRAIRTKQSWIVYPKDGDAIEIEEGPWAMDGERLIRAPGAGDDVCKGRLKGRCGAGGAAAPFKAFFKAQLAYCRSTFEG